jgi:tRNA (adenine57-N1/adenine58-N1)-methyltransferase
MSERATDDRADVPAEAWSGVRRGLLREGEWVRLVDQKGRKHNFELVAGKRFFSNKGHLDHDDMIGRDEGFTITSSAGGQYLVFRPLLSEFVVSMPRGAAVVYPKDAAQIVALADIYPGARVVEAGAGSGALTCSLLRAVGPWGRVTSFELREEFADVARRNVNQFFSAPEGQTHPAWDLRLGDLKEGLPQLGTQVDRIILDMLDPWNCIDVVADARSPTVSRQAGCGPPKNRSTLPRATSAKSSRRS